MTGDPPGNTSRMFRLLKWSLPFVVPWAWRRYQSRHEATSQSPLKGRGKGRR